ncbi:Similar to Bis(5'-nucleosyl)-tetraphosphatase; acc. no. P49776 [Pyronema omphalodes CBS 100304]|uniref:Bis(5'-adenosyl)-triphosphatase n=1 Tax=Pyronema omphalodes (strain CBS 100304) TaxID=1076935 RepID=U4LVQ0_PYROM|nr:Similar to Bis(5'-nucleosyl)-tetraphosphatase; acc. no. P49776 [Pyronema omphalodes CBS 100304]
MPPTTPIKALTFSIFPITNQVFYCTALSFAIVNLKPLLPGHVLVCPQRVVPRIHDLRPDEISDLFLAVQKVSRVLEKVYSAEGLNIAIQDGAVAGQSHRADLPEDEIYRLLESDDADICRAYRQHEGIDTPSTGMLAKGLAQSKIGADANLLREQLHKKNKFPVPSGERQPRTQEEMQKEAEWLAEKMEEFGDVE